MSRANQRAGASQHEWALGALLVERKEALFRGWMALVVGVSFCLAAIPAALWSSLYGDSPISSAKFYVVLGVGLWGLVSGTWFLRQASAHFHTLRETLASVAPRSMRLRVSERRELKLSPWDALGWLIWEDLFFLFLFAARYSRSVSVATLIDEKTGEERARFSVALNGYPEWKTVVRNRDSRVLVYAAPSGGPVLVELSDGTVFWPRSPRQLASSAKVQLNGAAKR